MFGGTGEGWRWALVGVLVVGVIALLYLGFSWRKENVVLKQAIKQMEMQLQEKERQVQELQDQIEELKKEQALRERRIAVLKQKREAVKPPKDVEEIVRRLRELGYEATLR